MKILWVTDNPGFPAAFGTVARYMGAGLSQRGHDVTLMGCPRPDDREQWGSCTYCGEENGVFNTDQLPGIVRQIRPDVLITFTVPERLPLIINPLLSGFLQSAGIPLAVYLAVNTDTGHNRLPDDVTDLFRTVSLPVCTSLFGQRTVGLSGIDALYIPLGVARETFIPPVNKADAKEWIGYSGRFVVLSDACNHPEEMLPRTLQIFRQFARDKNDAVLHLHCDPDNPAARWPEYFYSIKDDIVLLGLEEKVSFTPGLRHGKPADPASLRTVYQAADVHLSSGWGNSGGISLLQAASAGVVPVACEYGTGSEFTRNHGEPVPVAGFINDHGGIRRPFIDCHVAVERLNRLYDDRELLERKSAASCRFARSYSWDNVIDNWDALLRERIPALRNRVRRITTATLITPDREKPDRPGDLLRDLSGSGIPVASNVLTALSPDLPPSRLPAADPYREAFILSSDCTLPATPASWYSTVAKRETGTVLLAGVEDIPVFRLLIQVFPALRPWSSENLDIGITGLNGRHLRTIGINFGTPRFRQLLARTVLMFDVSATADALRPDAAHLGVPCIGPLSCDLQKQLWPQLSFDDEASAVSVARMARDLLTDQYRLETIMAEARTAVGTLAPSVEGEEKHHQRQS